jgi:large repetitive protein
MLPNILRFFIAGTLFFVMSFSSVAQCPNFALTSTSLKNACYDANDGYISVKLVGGPGYTSSNFSLWMRVGFAYTPITATSQVFNGDSIVFSGLTPNADFIPGSNYVVRFTDPSCAGGLVWEIFDSPLGRNTEIFANESSTAVCFGNDGQILVNPTGGIAPYTLTWTGGPTAIPVNENNPVNLLAGNYNLQIADAIGCILNTTIVVNPAPNATLSASGSTTICFGETTSIQVIVNNGTGPYTVVIDTTGTGAYRTILNYTSGTDIIIGPGASNTYSLVSVTDNNGCIATVSGSESITVNPLPDATITPAGPFCAADAAVNLTAATPGGIWSGAGITDANAGTFDPATAGAGSHTISYQVTVLGCTSLSIIIIDVNPMPDATITQAGLFCVTEGAVNLAAATPGGVWSGVGITDVNAGTFDPATAGAGSHTISYQVTVSGCTSIATTIIDVSPIPDATITPAGPFCASDGAVNLTAATPGGVWSGVGITDANAGTFDPATAGTGSHTISYEITIGACTSISSTIIDVNQAPDATITPAGPFCASDVAVNLTSATPGGLWSGAGITDANAGTFDPATAGAGSHTISYEVTVLGCTTIATAIIVVNSLPDATITPAGPFCASDGAVNLTAATLGGVWSGMGITDANAGTFDPATAGAGSHTISYEVTILGCTSIATTIITVNPLPDATITPAGPFCAADVAVNLTAATPGGIWSGAGITDANAGTFDPATAGAGSHTISYQVTVLGCTSLSTIIIDVNPMPDATITPAGPFCVTEGAVNLAAATPGGVWSGVGITDVNAGTFDPATAGAGSHTISYQVTVSGCTSIATTIIDVSPIPDATITPAGPFCASDGAVNLTAATAGGVWSGIGITDANSGTFDPATAGTGSHTISYEITIGACTSISSTIIDVNPAPDATITPAGPFCASDVAVNLTSATPGGLWSGAGITDTNAGTFDPATAGVGSHTISYEITTSGCTSIGTIIIVVSPIPVPTITGNFAVCGTVTETYNTESGNFNYIWQVTGGTITAGGGANDDFITINWDGMGPDYIIEVNYENAAGCAASSLTQEVVNVISVVAPVAINNGPVCQGGDIQLSTDEVLGATYTWSGPDGFTSNLREPVITGMTSAQSGIYSVTVSVGPCTSIAGNTNVIVSLDPLPTAVLSGSASICPGESAMLQVDLTGSGPWNFVYFDGVQNNLVIANSSPFTFPVDPTSTTTYTASSVTDQNCTGSVSGVATIDVSPAKDVTLSLDPVNGEPGDIVMVPLRAEGFQDLLTMQFTIVWNPDLLTLNGVEDFHISQANAGFVINNTNGFFTFSWYPENNSDTTIADGTDIFSLAFTIKNTVCTDAILAIDGSQTPIRIAASSGCEANVTVVNSNIDILPTASITSNDADNIICFGQQVIFTGLPGGMANYEFYLNGTLAQGGGNSVYVNNTLSDQDSVNVIVTDAAGCSLTAQGIITTVNQIEIVPTIIEITACGATDGEIALTVNGGSGNYSFNWSGPGIIDPALQNQANLGRGFYNVVVTDNNSGCSEILDVELKEPVDFVLSAVKNEVTATGGNDGSIDLTITGGTGPFTILWSGPSGFSSSNQNIANLFAGTYIALVTDNSSGCTDALTVSITQPMNALVLNAVKTDVTTCGAMDGTINLIVVGGSGSYSISWIGPNGFSAITQNIGGLEGGLYIATVVDLVTTISAQWTVQVNEPDNFVIAATVNDVQFCTSADGSIQLSISGGSGNFSYSWTDLSGLGFTSTDQNISDLAPGIYMVMVADNITGCENSMDFNIGRPAICEQPCALYVESTTNNTSCPDTQDGVAVINIISGGSGNGNYYVSLDTGKTFVPFAGQDITAIVDKGQGSYLYIVKDTVTGCMDTTVANVGVSTNLMANISLTNPGCAGNNGSIIFNVSGGLVPFEVQIIDSLGNVTTRSGNGFFQFLNLTAGSYAYTVREQSGCIIVATDSIELILNCETGCTSLIASARNFEDATCGSDPNGKAIIDVTGGASPYEYTIDGDNWIPFISGNVIDKLPPNGTYNIAIRQDADNADCRTTVGVTINGPELIRLISPIITTQKASCNQNDGAVKIGKVTGGTGAYSYQINGVFFTMPADSIVTEIRAGVHTFSVIDAVGCQADFTFIVESPGVIVATVTDVPVSCTSILLKAGIRIEIDISNTTLPGPYEAYVARASDPDNGIIYQVPDNGIRTILNLDKDFYIVNISSDIDGGCTFSETISVFSGASPVAFDIIESDSIVSCIGDLGSITIGNVIGDPNVPFIVQLVSVSDVILETYQVNLFEFEGGFTIDETKTNKLVAGKYYIKIIQNQDECAGVTAISDVITIYEPLGQLSFVVLEDGVSLADRPTGYIFGEVIPSGGNPYEVRIQLLDPVFEMNITDIIAFNEKRRWETVTSTGQNLNRFTTRIDSLWAGTYEIGVRDAYGCEYYIEHSIDYDETIFIPNVFTPNGDGYNDTFYIRNLPQSGTKVVISNRNGFTVFNSDDYNIDTLWDGGNVADGIYYYSIILPGGESFKGWVEKWSGARP